MYTWDKKEINYKSRKAHKDTPSFSSTLLDEIYRSIDEKTEDFKGYREKPVKRHGGLRPKAREKDEDEEEMGSFRRACLVEKWMEKDENEKIVSKMRPPLLPDNDLVFFSSTSSSSDSSGQLSSSSDTEFFGSQTRPKVSCFAARPKPVRTSARDKSNPNPKQEERCYPSDDHRKNHQKKKPEEDDDLIKYKSRALKIYANLKKVKQPISPGGRLTSFINSLFNNNGEAKKTKKNVEKIKTFQDSNPPSSSACSSASSFSRSCLSKYSPKSREKMRNGIQRTVRFHPVSVIVDEDSRPCGHKSIYDEDIDKFSRPPLPRQELKLSQKMEKNRRVEEATQCVLKGINDFSSFRRDEDEEDTMSDSSSDLFELDHSSLFGNNRFCEELPVYETTRLDNNRAIASHLIR